MSEIDSTEEMSETFSEAIESPAFEPVCPIDSQTFPPAADSTLDSTIVKPIQVNELSQRIQMFKSSFKIPKRQTEHIKDKQPSTVKEKKQIPFG